MSKCFVFETRTVLAGDDHVRGAAKGLNDTHLQD